MHRQRERRREESIPVKTVDTGGYLREIETLLRQGHQPVIPVSGFSMRPFLCHGRDYVMLENIQLSHLKTGDIVLYVRQNGCFVLHRVRKIKGGSFYAVGDAQSVIEGPLRLEQICGRVCNIRRKGVWMGDHSLWEWFFRTVWIRAVPCRAWILKKYERRLGRKRSADFGRSQRKFEKDRKNER